VLYSAHFIRFTEHFKLDAKLRMHFNWDANMIYFFSSDLLNTVQITVILK